MKMMTEQKVVSYATDLSNLKLLSKKRHNFEKMKYTITNFKCCHVLDHLYFILNPVGVDQQTKKYRFHKKVKKKFCSIKHIILKENGLHLKK